MPRPRYWLKHSSSLQDPTDPIRLPDWSEIRAINKIEKLLFIFQSPSKALHAQMNFSCQTEFRPVEAIETIVLHCFLDRCPNGVKCQMSPTHI